MNYPAYRGLDKLTAETQARAQEFLKDATARGIFILITETWRSPERQSYLYSLGRTQPGQIVTWTLESKHITGEAFDVAFLKNAPGTPGNVVTYDGDWAAIGAIGEMHGLSWGGRWPTPDKPHFQFNPDWQGDHWGAPYEQKLLDAGAISTKKDLNAPPSRAEVYVMLCRLHNL